MAEVIEFKRIVQDNEQDIYDAARELGMSDVIILGVRDDSVCALTGDIGDVPRLIGMFEVAKYHLMENS